MAASLKAKEELPEPDYDFDFGEENTRAEEQKDSDVTLCDYILGTLIVNVVAGRHLFYRSRGRRLLDAESANPYALLWFGSQSQQKTSEAIHTTDPVWPREEQSYFDVNVQVRNLAQECDFDVDNKANGKYPEKSKASNDAPDLDRLTSPQRPILTVALFHSTQHHKGKGSTCNDDPFLGSFSIDLTDVLTGKVPCFDEWTPLEGCNDIEDVSGELRIICEYEPSYPPPRPGDMCRFTGFCDPVDVYPVPPAHTFRVDDVDGDEVILSYTSPEGWLCTFRVHRFMLICASRHQAAVEKYRAELTKLACKLSCSPLVQTLQETVDRVPDEGLLFIGAEAAVNSAALLGRWFEGGVDTAVGDIIYASNLDGRHSSNVEVRNDDASDNEEKDCIKSEDDGGERKETPLPGMPCCPITGEPMVDPVVAADGHTFEREAIARWLETSNTSPLTGCSLPHKELVPNYLLLSSCQKGEGKV